MAKALTGINGLDALTRGGVPRARATLLDGGAGSGKTILALQFLVNGVRQFGEPGIFVAFEENSRDIVENAASFDWGLPALEREGLYFLDAQPKPDLIQSGEFDLGGLLAALDSKVKAIGAKRVVFDAIDTVLALLTDPKVVRRELYRLNRWLVERGLTTMITVKAAPGYTAGVSLDLLDFLQFMVHCSLSLSHDIVDGVSQRSLRVAKMRGSAFEENETPFVFGSSGMEIAAGLDSSFARPRATNERVSSGIERLDTMLGGGYYRGASVLLTGSPGTAKTTLAGCFAAAACKRGEKVLFVSFDSFADELIRNLNSVDIDLGTHVANGLLRISPAIASNSNAEIHLMQIKALAHEHGAHSIVVDPLSALAKSGNQGISHSVAERFIGWTKEKGVTAVCTSLLDHLLPLNEGTPLQVSTIADTWIHLNYLVQAGERNRGLSIIKSRGTEHSNQVRELLLSARGVTLSDVYSSNGEVLMGTLRWTKERAERLAAAEIVTQADQQRVEVEAEVVELEGRSKAVQSQLAVKRAYAARLIALAAGASREIIAAEVDIRFKRQADQAAPGGGVDPNE